MDGVGDLAALVQQGAAQRLDLLWREGEIGRVELEHLPLRTEPVDTEVERLAGEQHETQPRRALSAEALHQPQGRRRRGQLLCVVEDQHEVVVERGLERVAQQGGERLGLHELVVGRGQRPEQLRGVSDEWTNRLSDSHRER